MGAARVPLADLIPRFYDVSEGQITVDGTDLRALTLASLRSQIAVVTQATFLFNDTVRNNIAYGMPHRPEEEIITAAKAAHAHDFIMALPEGYATQNRRARGAAVRRSAPTARYCPGALEERAHVDP